MRTLASIQQIESLDPIPGAYYARTTAKNIRQMNRDYPGEYDREVAWLPLLDALHAELATGEQMSASEAAVILAAAETAYARAL